MGWRCGTWTNRTAEGRSDCAEPQWVARRLGRAAVVWHGHRPISERGGRLSGAFWLLRGCVPENPWVSGTGAVVGGAGLGVALGGELEIGLLAALVLGLEVLEEGHTPAAAGSRAQALADE